MDRFENFSEEDLLLNESFHNWVKKENPADIQYWEKWIARYPERSIMVQNARNMILSLSAEDPEVPASEVAEAWGQLQQTLAQRKLSANTRKASSKIWPGLFTRWYAVAAMFVGVCIGALLIAYLVMPHAYVYYSTNYGETKSIILPDSSKVILNGNTSLRYKEKWSAHETREVWLDGEAYFCVKKSDKQPHLQFIVHTERLDVEVLGTQFNVSNRKKATQVVLNEGRVKVNPKQDTNAAAQVLKPGELLEYSNMQRTITKRVVNPTMYTSWKLKKMVFDETSMQELADRIEATYGYQVLFTDKALASRKLSGTIPSDNIDVLMLTLAKLFNLDIRKEQTHIIIKSIR